jgi:LysM repeat protein
MSRIHPNLKFCLLGFALLLRIASAEDVIYKVKANDTLSGIASAHGVRTSDLIAHNQLANPDELKLGQELRIPPKPGGPRTYVVAAGDTLERIAQRHGVKTTDLAALNELEKPDQLKPGQTLKIPASATAPPLLPPSRGRASLSPGLKRQLDAIPVRKGRWKYIVIHHSATAQGTAAGMDRYHRKERRMENGLAYHFVIGNGRGTGDGVIEIGNRWPRQIKGGHLASDAQNNISIGICLVGHFDKQKPTARQMDSLVELIRYLQNRCGLDRSAIRLHRQINTRPTMCPGRLFPEEELLRRLGGGRSSP